MRSARPVVTSTACHCEERSDEAISARAPSFGLRVGLTWALCLLLVVPAWAQIPAKPNPPRLVNDFAHLLSADEAAQLEQKLVAYDDSTSTQIAVVTVPTLGDYEVADFGQKLGESWGVGGRGNNNGILVLVAQQERKLNISTGYGMEERVTDAQSRLIIERLLKPAFKQKQYYQGLDAATTQIIQLASGTYKAPAGYTERGRADRDGGGPPLWLIILIVVLIVWFISRRGGGGRGGWGSSRGGFFPPVILGGGGGGGWGGGGGSGDGGFGGFGGGSFGGGGASGDW